MDFCVKCDGRLQDYKWKRWEWPSGYLVAGVLFYLPSVNSRDKPALRGLQK